MKCYQFELIVHEGSDEFWEELTYRAGCDEVTEAVAEALMDHGFVVGDNCELTLKKYVSDM